MYWNFGRKEKKKMCFFVIYEELKEDPNHHVRRLAEFLGCSLRSDQIVQESSFERLSELDVNKDRENVHWSGMAFGNFFRQL